LVLLHADLASGVDAFGQEGEVCEDGNEGVRRGCFFEGLDELLALGDALRILQRLLEEILELKVEETAFLGLLLVNDVNQSRIYIAI
jgi:hypothetical protein